MSDESLYAKYVRERQGLTTIEGEGFFLTYKIMGEELFLIDMFVDDSIRKTGIGKSLIDRLAEVARASRCDHISANVWMWDPNADATLHAAIRTGFKVVSAHNGCLTILKRVKGES